MTFIRTVNPVPQHSNPATNEFANLLKFFILQQLIRVDCFQQSFASWTVCMHKLVWAFTNFPTYRRFLTPLQHTTFENIVTNREIAQYKQFLYLSQCFQLFALIIQRFSWGFANMLSQVVCCRFAVCGKGLILIFDEIDNNKWNVRVVRIFIKGMKS